VEEAKAVAEKQRREEAELKKPIQCPEYTYPKEPESFTSDALNVTLVAPNRFHAGAVKVSSDVGLTVEECANRVLESGSVCGNNFEYMSYSEASGCSCYPGSVAEGAFEAAQGTHMFRIE
jgi:hypothetical protein